MQATPGTGSSPTGTGSSPPGTGSPTPGTGSSTPGTSSSPPGPGSYTPGTSSSPPDFIQQNLQFEIFKYLLDLKIRKIEFYCVINNFKKSVFIYNLLTRMYQNQN